MCDPMFSVDVFRCMIQTGGFEVSYCMAARGGGAAVDPSMCEHMFKITPLHMSEGGGKSNLSTASRRGSVSEWMEGSGVWRREGQGCKR